MNVASHHLWKGLLAYASEMTDKEQSQSVLWAMKWAAICEHAQLVLKKHLQDDESSDSDEAQIPMLRVDIGIGDDNKIYFLSSFSDDE